MAAYMHDTAAQLSRHPKDVSWIVQLPYVVAHGECLSSAGPTSDFSSALSLALAHSAFVIECIFLEAEHECLDVSTGEAVPTEYSPGCPSLVQQLRDDWEHQSQWDDTPADLTEPDEGVLRCLHVSTAVHSSCLLSVAMKRVVSAMLHRCMHTALPYALWQAACMRAVQWLQASVKGMRKRAPNAETWLAQQVQALALKNVDGGDVDMATQGPLSAVPAAQLVTMQAMLFEVSAALRNSSPQVPPPMLPFHMALCASMATNTMHSRKAASTIHIVSGPVQAPSSLPSNRLESKESNR